MANSAGEDMLYRQYSSYDLWRLTISTCGVRTSAYLNDYTEDMIYDELYVWYEQKYILITILTPLRNHIQYIIKNYT